MCCYVYWIDDDRAPLRLHQFFHNSSTLDAPSSKICADVGGAELIFLQRMQKFQLLDDLRAYDGLGHGEVYQGPSTTPNRYRQRCQLLVSADMHECCRRRGTVSNGATV